jgi:hypothetical protein
LPSVVKAAVCYFAIVFAVGFFFGVLRVLVVAPAIGELAATTAELTILLFFSWVICTFLVRRFEIASSLPRRLAMGAIAFSILMLCELAFSTLLFNQTVIEYFAQFNSLAAMLGLAGQVMFAAIPVLQLHKRY